MKDRSFEPNNDNVGSNTTTRVASKPRNCHQTQTMICTGALIVLISSLAVTLSTAAVQDSQVVPPFSLPTPSYNNTIAIQRGCEQSEELGECQFETTGIHQPSIAAIYAVAEEPSQETPEFAEAMVVVEAQVAMVMEAQVEQKAQEVGASGGEVENTISKDLHVVGDYAAALEEYVAGVLEAEKLTISQGVVCVSP